MTVKPIKNYPGFFPLSDDPTGYGLREGGEYKLPQSTPGGGTVEGPYGGENKVAKMTVKNGEWVEEGEWEPPDSIKYNQNDAVFLQRKYDERMKEKKAASAGTPTYMTVPQPPEPVKPMFEGSSEGEGVSTADVELPSPVIEGSSEGESGEILVFRTPFGDFKTSVVSAVATAQFIICFYNRDKEVFEPNVAKSEEDSFDILVEGEAYRVVYAGDTAKVPGSNLNIMLLHRL